MLVVSARAHERQAAVDAGDEDEDAEDGDEDATREGHGQQRVTAPLFVGARDMFADPPLVLQLCRLVTAPPAAGAASCAATPYRLCRRVRS